MLVGLVLLNLVGLVFDAGIHAIVVASLVALG